VSATITKGSNLSVFPPEPWVLEKVVPRYKIMKGWKSPIQHLTDRSRLPAEFTDYVKFIEDSVEARVCLISTGVDRKDSLSSTKNSKAWSILTG